jgi:hypothetical protein
MAIIASMLPFSAASRAWLTAKAMSGVIPSHPEYSQTASAASAFGNCSADCLSKSPTFTASGPVPAAPYCPPMMAHASSYCASGKPAAAASRSRCCMSVMLSAELNNNQMLAPSP